MPARDAERFVATAIHSLLTQTYRDLEIIVVDDASTDRTAEIVRSIADSRVRLVPLDTHHGVAGAANQALARAAGDFIARLDADDIAFSHRIATQVAWLETHPDVALLAGQMHIIDERGRTTGRAVQWHGRALHYALLLECPLFHPSVMLRRQALPPAGYAPVAVKSEDWLLYLALLRGGWRLEALDEPLGIYRRHAGAIGNGPPRVTIAPEFGEHLRLALGLRCHASTVSAWIGPYTAAAAKDPTELYELARRLAPENLPDHVLAAAPPWTPSGLRRARRAYLRRIVAIARHAWQGGRHDLTRRLATLVPGAFARALRLPPASASR